MKTEMTAYWKLDIIIHPPRGILTKAQVLLVEIQQAGMTYAKTNQK